MIEHNEMVATLIDVSQRLRDLGIDYMVTGSFAMSFYVPARTTMDIDIVLEVGPTDSTRIERRFAGDYYISAASVTRAYERSSMFNIVSNSTLVKVDCIVKKQDPFEVEKFERRRRAKIGKNEFWVVSKEDLILSKLKWAAGSYSERQFEDIQRLLESGVDKEFLSEMIRTTGLNGVWQAFEEWKIRAAR
jgi:hypothetical protein